MKTGRPPFLARSYALGMYRPHVRNRAVPIMARRYRKMEHRVALVPIPDLGKEVIHIDLFVSHLNNPWML